MTIINIAEILKFTPSIYRAIILAKVSKEVAMRQMRPERQMAKKQAREMSMMGWDRPFKGLDKRRMMASRSSRRQMSLGMGHRLARMMKGHI